MTKVCFQNVKGSKTHFLCVALLFGLAFSQNALANEDYWSMPYTRQYFYCAGYLTKHFEIVDNSYVAQNMSQGYSFKLKKLSNESKSFKEEMDEFFSEYFNRGFAERSYLLDVNDGYDHGQVFVHCTRKFNGY